MAIVEATPFEEETITAALCVSWKDCRTETDSLGCCHQPNDQTDSLSCCHQPNIQDVEETGDDESRPFLLSISAEFDTAADAVATLKKIQVMSLLMLRLCAT